MVFNMIWTSTLETLYMVFFSTIFSMVIGFPIGILLVVTKEGNILERPAQVVATRITTEN